MKTKSKTIVIMLSAFLSVTFQASGQNYNKIMTQSVKKSLGKDFKKYSAFSYPTNNFGVITSFENRLSPENQVCAMSRCLNGLELGENEWMTLKGICDIGEGGAITLTQKVQTSISVKAILPKLWDVLGLGADFNKNKVKTVTLSIGPGVVRYVNKLQFTKFIDALPDNDAYKKKYVQGSLVVVTSDVVVKYLNVTVDVDDTTAMALNAKLDAGQLSKQFGNVELDFKMERMSNGKYTFTVNKPVIILRLARKQPSAGSLGVGENFDTWPIQKDFIK